ncbi:hypothetical protein [Niastella sp. OAS944]|uniref:hypothetical protein n=1 Tax=Niastella sp. OAS944 TaxID=2664089 RepID=UPI0034847C26|nr:hypothetical protein [Chitinophagaceae bacterium OAS944]
MTINLTWKVADEKDVNRYEVQRSRDGVTFETIGIVFAWEEAVHADYAFNDKNTNPGINYYRLKMTDNDGVFKYSNILNSGCPKPYGKHDQYSANGFNRSLI